MKKMIIVLLLVSFSATQTADKKTEEKANKQFRIITLDANGNLVVSGWMPKSDIDIYALRMASAQQIGQSLLKSNNSAANTSNVSTQQLSESDVKKKQSDAQ